MVLLKIAMVGVALVVLMGVARAERWPQRAGVIGVCVSTPAPRSEPSGAWYACTQGIMSGFPNLEGDGCSSAGIAQSQEIWRCEGALVSLPGA